MITATIPNIRFRRKSKEIPIHEHVLNTIAITLTIKVHVNETIICIFSEQVFCVQKKRGGGISVLFDILKLEDKTS